MVEQIEGFRAEQKQTTIVLTEVATELKNLIASNKEQKNENKEQHEKIEEAHTSLADKIEVVKTRAHKGITWKSLGGVIIFGIALIKGFYWISDNMGGQ